MATAAAPSYQQAALGGSGMPQFQQQALPPGGPLGLGISMGMGNPGGGHPATPPLGQVGNFTHETGVGAWVWLPLASAKAGRWLLLPEP